MKISEFQREIRRLANPEIAEHSQRFFKTGPGEYGEGDRFLGVRMPAIRKTVARFSEMDIDAIRRILTSEWHEERIGAVLLLVRRFERGTPQQQAEVYRVYLKDRRFVNNWDLVDASAHRIVGPYLESRSRAPLARLAKSKSQWDRRIAILATFHFIRQHDFDDILALAERMLDDPEDLIHKATGWMLREVANRNRDVAEQFLAYYYQQMPRTMLRYAIERFPDQRRKAYLHGTA